MRIKIEVAATLLPEEAERLICEACQDVRFLYSHYPSEDELLIAIGTSPPNIVVMGLNGGGSRPLALQRKLWTAREPACVIFFAGNPNTEAVVTAMQFGAALIPAGSGLAVCQDALKEAGQLHAARSMWINDTRDAQQRLNELSPRQREVMQMALAGRPNKTIALQLNISVKTVEKHRDVVRQRTHTLTAPELERLNAVAERPLTAVYRLRLSEIQELVARGAPRRNSAGVGQFRAAEM